MPVSSLRKVLTKLIAKTDKSRTGYGFKEFSSSCTYFFAVTHMTWINPRKIHISSKNFDFVRKFDVFD